MNTSLKYKKQSAPTGAQNASAIDLCNLQHQLIVISTTLPTPLKVLIYPFAHHTSFKGNIKIFHTPLLSSYASFKIMALEYDAGHQNFSPSQLEDWLSHDQLLQKALGFDYSCLKWKQKFVDSKAKRQDITFIG